MLLGKSEMNRPERRKKVIMVMGVQRSGTSVLFESFAADKSLAAYPEDIDDAIYYRFRLRPLPEIERVIEAAPGPVLLKPICETFDRTLVDLRRDYSSHDVRFVWIYRDPVNVLYSMHRQGWISAPDMALNRHVEAWCRRNTYALQLKEQFPGQIAVVRYEDLSLDPNVFRKLTDWLGVKGKYLFRSDSEGGRRDIPSRIQHEIGIATRETMQALAGARRFKPGPIRSFRKVAWTVLRARCQAGTRKTNSEAIHPGVVPIHQTSPEPLRERPAVEGLHFWLDASSCCPARTTRPPDVMESGPSGMSAPNPPNGPYCVSGLRGKGSLFYPHTKAGMRRDGASGILVFGSTADWKFMADGGPFTIFALFRPNVPCYSPYYQQYSKLLRVGAVDGGQCFGLEWSHHDGATSAVIKSEAGSAEMAASTSTGSHPRQQWRLITARFVADGRGELSISANGNAGQPVSARPSSAATTHGLGERVLQIGGVEGEPETLFYGEIAEILFFKRALDNPEQLLVTGYLRQKYQL